MLQNNERKSKERNNITAIHGLNNNSIIKNVPRKKDKNIKEIKKCSVENSKQNFLHVNIIHRSFSFSAYLKTICRPFSLLLKIATCLEGFLRCPLSINSKALN